ncbi:MAG: dTMP kinase [Pseudonocardiaceae bacterium]
MTSCTDDQPRLPGTLIAIDGPGGVGKSSAVTAAVELLTAVGLPVHGTRQPSRAELGELARHSTDTYRGMSLACLCAADRHHQLDTEIKPALQEGRIVLCDRYVASSLVLQGLDGVPSQLVWQLNHGVYRPDLSLILTGNPAVITARLRARGGHSRFERAADNSARESALYARAVADLQDKGWPVQTVDCTTEGPDIVAARIVSLIHRTLGEKSPVCP